MGAHTSREREVDAAVDAIRRIVHALRASSRWAEQHVGLSGAQLFVLQKLEETPGMSINEIAERTHTHQSSVSTVVARLIESGLVRRVRSATDGRRVALTLAAAGERIVARAPDVAQDRLIGAIVRLPAARRQELAATLDQLARAVDTDSRPPQMFFEEDPRRRTARKVAATGTSKKRSVPRG